MKKILKNLRKKEMGGAGLAVTLFVAAAVTLAGGALLSRSIHISDVVSINAESEKTNNVLDSVMGGATNILDTGRFSGGLARNETGHWRCVWGWYYRCACTPWFNLACQETTFPEMSQDPDYPDFKSAVAVTNASEPGVYILAAKVENKKTGEIRQQERRFIPARVDEWALVKFHNNDDVAVTTYPDVVKTTTTTTYTPTTTTTSSEVWVPATSPSGCGCHGGGGTQRTLGRTNPSAALASTADAAAPPDNAAAPSGCPEGQTYYCSTPGTPGHYETVYTTTTTQVPTTTTSTTNYGKDFGTMDIQICKKSSNPTDWALDEAMLINPDNTAAPFSSCHTVEDPAPGGFATGFRGVGFQITSVPPVPVGNSYGGALQVIGGATVRLEGGANFSSYNGDYPDGYVKHYLTGVGMAQEKLIKRVAAYVADPGKFQTPAVPIVHYSGTINGNINCPKNAPAIFYIDSNAKFTGDVTGWCSLIVNNPNGSTQIVLQIARAALRAPLVLRDNVGVAINEGKITGDPGKGYAGQTPVGAVVHVIFADVNKMPAIYFGSTFKIARADESWGINQVLNAVRALKNNQETGGSGLHNLTPVITKSGPIKKADRRLNS